MLKFGIISIMKAISCLSSGKRMRLLDVYGRVLKYQEVSYSCDMLQLGIERRSTVFPVCRYVFTIPIG